VRLIKLSGYPNERAVHEVLDTVRQFLESLKEKNEVGEFQIALNIMIKIH
jgi:hypothetical protein